MRKLERCLVAALVAIVWCVCAWWTIAPFSAEAAEWRDMNRQIDATNFLVNRGCSGTLVDADKGLVLSAYHCINQQYETVEREKIDDNGVVTKEKVRIAKPGTVSQIFFSGAAEAQRNEYVYKIAASDAQLDLSLLKVRAQLRNAKAAPLACQDVDRGDTVFAVGNSYGVLYSTLTKGIVASLTRSYRDLLIAGQLGDQTDAGEHGLVQHSAPIVGGNSGGALYNDSGELVGVNVRGADTGFSFSVPLADVRDFLARANAEYLWKRCEREQD